MSHTAEPVAGSTAVFPLSALTDPYPFYEELRARGRLHRIITPLGREAWFVPHHADACSVLSDPGFSKARHHADTVSADGRKAESALADNMVSTDPPEHTRLRRLVQAAFTRRQIERLRPRIQEIADDLLDDIGRKPRAELIRDYALPLPMLVIAELLGLPRDDLGVLMEHAVFLREIQPSGDLVTRFREQQAELGDYARRVIERKRVEPGDDLIQALIEARDGANRLSERELVTTVMLFIFAGFLTTANLIGNGAHELLVNPEQRDLLRARPELTGTAVEEFLRFQSSISVVEGHAKADIPVAEQVIPAGSLIFLPVHSLNRDPAIFVDPDRLDITRTPNPHLAFSHGVHYCLGAHLARVEGQVALDSLFRRFPGMVLDCEPGEVGWCPSFFIRSIRELPVRLAAQTSSGR
ncbi:cytochrome P450 [Spongiactinospora sp. TRM90649]|uniref:cytochrome P450 family protein n=1 Tax=Spongiactinospora sp. TRM90649 TaxID=3031114 RepID=UPI0023F82C7E|nr:cytochrome P450 [Spongiactinospora sp. TRM90649]MDF5758309.1 cytochrome P450 [Spongiactinospora sp. TRM90649]